MALSTGVDRQVIIAKEATYGVSPAAGAASRYKDRTEISLNLTRDTFTSARISSTAQTSDMRGGMNSCELSLSDELSAGSFELEWAALLRGAWTAGVTVTSTGIQINATTKKLIRTTGSWITDGFKKGDLIIVSGATNAANNIAYTIVAITALEITYGVVIGTDTPVNEAAGASITVKVPGKKLSIPFAPANRTNDSFTIEQFFSAAGVSERYVGVKMGSASVEINPNAYATCEFTGMGSTMLEPGVAQYFTAPAAAPTTSVLAGNVGAVYFNGVRVAVATAASFEVNSDLTQAEVVGSREAPDVFRGRIGATGEISLYFENSDVQSIFRNEQDVSLVIALQGTDGTYMAFNFPRIRLEGAEKDDSETEGIVQTCSFTALLPTSTSSGTVDQSTIVVYDSSLV